MTTDPAPPHTPAEMAAQVASSAISQAAPEPLSTPSANAFFAPEGAQLVSEQDEEGVVRLVSSGSVLPGLPVRSSNRGETNTRSLAERRDAAELRARHGRDPRTDAGESADLSENAPYKPEGMPTAMPIEIGSLDSQRYGVNSRGSRTQLSEHSTIIGGESRSLIYPGSYPYTAICKLYVQYQATSGAWLNSSEATGFMVGPRVMVTSGHVQPVAGRPWAIKVIPGCWNGVSVYGANFLSYVSDNWWWHSDSGSDIQVCRLYDPIGNTTGWFGTKNYSSSWEDHDYWTMAGFPYDINLTHMSHETAIAVRDDDDGDDISVDGRSYDTTQVESDADEASGASGSPLWGDWNGPYAIGVHHGVEYDGTVFGTETLSCASGGDGFLAAVNWARRIWP